MEGDQEKEQFVVKFSNGALKQLEELKAFFNLPNEEEVVKSAISLMQSIKNRTPKKEEPHTSSF